MSERPVNIVMKPMTPENAARWHAVMVAARDAGSALGADLRRKSRPWWKRWLP